MEQITNAGYIIKDQVTIKGETYVLGHNPNPNTPAPYVTWSANLNENYFVFGHYFGNEEAARRDLFKRAFEHLPEHETDQLADDIMSDTHKEAIIREAREGDHLANIESCLWDAADNLKLAPETVQTLMGDLKFRETALSAYDHQNHSYENEALTESLEQLIKEQFPQFLNDKEPLQSFYYTFGTAEQFPHKHGWVEVKAEDRTKADKLFRAHYPDKNPGVLNCAFVYNKDEFDRIYEETYKKLPIECICHNVISQYDLETGAPSVSQRETLDDKIHAAEGKKTGPHQSKTEQKEPER